MILAVENRITPQDVARITETQLAVHTATELASGVLNRLRILRHDQLERVRKMLLRGARRFEGEDTPENIVERQVCVLRAGLEQGLYDRTLSDLLEDAEKLVCEIKELQLRELMSPLLDNTP